MIARGLSMPHWGDQLWVLNAGTGHFGRIDRDSGQFEPLAFLPRFPRSLSFMATSKLLEIAMQTLPTVLPGKLNLSVEEEPNSNSGTGVPDAKSSQLSLAVFDSRCVRPFYGSFGGV